jgi:N-acetylmuramoyl-L-alanine amidase
MVVLLLACTRTVAPTTVPTPASGGVRRPALPPVPAVDGPLAVNVVYPRPDQVITSRDSNFIFGSIGSGRATLRINGAPARVYPNGAFIAFVANPPGPSPRYELVAERGGESIRTTLNIAYPPAREAVLPSPAAAVAVKPEALATSRADTLAILFARLDSLRGTVARGEPIGLVQLGVPNAAADSDRTIIGRPVPGGTYKWFFLPGTVVPLVAREGGFARVRLDGDLDVYVDTLDARDVPATTAAERRVTANMKVRPSRDGVDLVIPLGARAPYFVEEQDRAIVLTLYGVRGNTDLVNYANADSMVRTVEWAQETTDRARVTVGLRSAPYGYLVVWENNALVLKIRGHPRIDPQRPAAGLTIAVDPGHPPIGATGPTGLWEPQATLPIGQRLKAILEERGARVVMTRTTADPVALGDRPDHRAARQRQRVRVDPPERVSRRREPVRRAGHGHVLLPRPQRAARARGAARHGVAHGAAGPRRQLRQPRRRARHVVSRRAVRRGVHHAARPGGGAAHARVPGPVRARGRDGLESYFRALNAR